MNSPTMSNHMQILKPILLSSVLTLLVSQSLVAQKQSRIEKKAKSNTALVNAKMELTEDQIEALRSALLTKYKNNAAGNPKELDKEAKQKLFKNSRQAFAESLASQFSKEEIKKLTRLLAQERSKGTAIFNGKNLDGWKQVNGTATYEVIDGAIVGTTAVGSPNSFLATTKKYGNFDLTFDVFLVNNELNSGVQFRSAQHTEESLKTSKKKKHTLGRVYGYQCEIEASAVGDMDTKKYGDAGYIYDEARRGWLVDNDTRLSAKTRGAFKNNAWNKMRILANGDHIQTWINGKKISDLKDDMTAEGFIALQVHGIGKRDEKWQVKWKNINIKELP